MPKKIKEESKKIPSIELYGHNTVFDNLKNLYKKKSFPKVLMLTGEKGIGKFTLTFHLINYFLTDETEFSYNINQRIINKKSTVFNELISGSSPNYTYISNENSSKANIELIRELKKSFINTSLNDKPRFIVFDDVEHLNINTANSLLKLIEEPSNTNYFILINNKRNFLIETIRSRSIETKFFLTVNDKKTIFNNLKKLENLEDHFSFDFIDYTTPGLLLEYSKIFDKYNINTETSLYDAVSIFLEKFKKTKNEILLDCVNFFLEIKSSTSKQNNINSVLSISARYNLMKLIYNYKKFNLTNNTVLEYIKKTENHFHA